MSRIQYFHRRWRPRLMSLRSSLSPLTPMAPVLGPLLIAVSSLAGCANQTYPETIVKTPVYPPLMDAQTSMAQTGGIYQNGTAVAFFETRRARHIGDLLTVRLQEAFVTSNVADTEASRSSAISATAADKSTNAAARLARFFNVGSADMSFTGKGKVTGKDSLTGTLAVSVISTLPSGNLMVSGEKMIATNNVNSRMRFSGIVNPVDIEPDNSVPSTKIANARVEQAGIGVLRDSTTLGFLQRLFMNVLTF